jgi:hypothetical protein
MSCTGKEKKALTEYVVPPHWSASRRHTTAGTKIVVPRRSSWRSLLPRGAFAVSGVGTLRNMAMTTMAAPPMGRLM